MTRAEDQIQFAAAAIMAHLHLRPGSADTVEGIHEWWIDWASAPESILVTSAALELLEQNGAVERRSASSRVVWRLAQALD